MPGATPHTRITRKQEKALAASLRHLARAMSAYDRAGYPVDGGDGKGAETVWLPAARDAMGAASDQLVQALEHLHPLTAEQFNAAHPVGTPVRYWPQDRLGEATDSRTRTPAWTLGSGHAVVSVEGASGGIALSHVLVDDDHESIDTTNAS